MVQIRIYMLLYNLLPLSFQIYNVNLLFKHPVADVTDATICLWEIFSFLSDVKVSEAPAG